jgi:hypothetical protein
MLKVSPDVNKIRTVVHKRLMDDARLQAQEKILHQMLLTLAKAGFVTLEPEPPAPVEGQPQPPYEPDRALPTASLDKLLIFRSVHPLYGAFLIDQLGIADRNERLMALESVLEMPRPLLRYVRVPYPEDLPPGPLEKERLDPELVRRGLITAHADSAAGDDEEGDWVEEDEYPPTMPEKLRLYFDALHPDVADVNTQSVWAAGELLRFGGNFNKFVQSKDLIKQEGIIFRHLLRLILLCGEFIQLTPPDVAPEAWRAELRDIADQLTAGCRQVDPTSTDEIIEMAHAADVVEGETGTPAPK